jgi:hypothetical protein
MVSTNLASSAVIWVVNFTISLKNRKAAVLTEKSKEKWNKYSLIGM